jgi:glycosyltransferase involved in cell wall biosynthesis
MDFSEATTLKKDDLAGIQNGKTNMRIALFSDSYDSSDDYNDGVSVVVQKFTEYAVRHELHLRVFANGYVEWTEEISDTVKVHRFKPTIPWHLLKYSEFPLDLVIPNPRLMAIFEETPFDLVHFTQPSIMGGNALYAAGRSLVRFPLTVPAIIASIDSFIFRKKRSRVLPLVGSFHTNVPAFVQFRTGSRFLRRRCEEMMDYFYKNCDMILAPSLRCLEEIAQYIRGETFGLIQSGVDIDAFHPQNRDEEFRKALGDKTILLFAGRVTPEKNIRFLRNVYVELRARYSDIHLFIAGDGELREWLVNDLGEEVTAPGFLYGKDICKVFASSDIFLFPSTADTLGLVVLEAQASGLPVVVMDQGGPMEVMEDGKTGFVCKANIIDDFVEKAGRLIMNSEMRKRMGLAARALAMRFSWDQAFDDLLNVYEKVLSHDY